MIKKFTEHPRSLGMTYSQHMIHASEMVWECSKISVALAIHSFFPFLFTNYASKKFKELAGE